MIRVKSLFLITGLGFVFLFLNCGLLDIEQTPTKTKMLGLWELTEAYDKNGKLITEDINFPITAFHLSSDNGVISTAGPMMMMVVYGNGNYTKIASKIDQSFNYASLSFTNGEWFIKGGYPDRFTLEMKLEGLPGQKAITDLLDLIGIGKDYLDIVIYHMFMDVHVEFEPLSDSLMTWEFDDQTTAEYNSKNDYGKKVLWNGISVNSFARCKFTFKKRVGTLQSLVQNAAKK